MKISGGSKDAGKWTSKEVRALLLAKTGQMVTLAECVKFLRELGLPLVPDPNSLHSDSAHVNWKSWISDDFTSWRNEHCPKTLKRRESQAARTASKRSSEKTIGSPTLSKRIGAPIIKKYQLNDPMLKEPHTMAEHFAKIASKYSQ